MLDVCGEFFVLGFNGYTVPGWVREFAQKHGLGGVILFDYDCATARYARNVSDPVQLRGLCREIAALPTHPLVFIDQEGGKVRRLKETCGFHLYPSARDFAQLTVGDRLACARRSFSEMRECGVHYNLAPVIDIDRNPANPDIGVLGRAYGDTAEVVAENVEILDRVAREVNLGLCVKHFPGIGGSSVNSHVEVMELPAAIDREQIDLFYRLAPRVHGEAMLLSHALLVHRDPVSVSAEWVRTIREKCPDVLLLSDDLQMRGLQNMMSTAQAVQDGLRAGVDLLVLGNNLVHEDMEVFVYVEEVARSFGGDVGLVARAQESRRRIRDRKRRFSSGEL